MRDLPVDAALAGAAVLEAHAGSTYATSFPLLPHRILGHGEESRMLVFGLDVLAQRRHRAHSPGSDEHLGVLFAHRGFIYVRCWGGEPIPRLVHAGKSVLQLGTGVQGVQKHTGRSPEHGGVHTVSGEGASLRGLENEGQRRAVTDVATAREM